MDALGRMKSLVIDVCVFIAAVRPPDRNPQECLAFLRRVHALEAIDKVRVREAHDR